MHSNNCKFRSPERWTAPVCVVLGLILILTSNPAFAQDMPEEPMAPQAALEEVERRADEPFSIAAAWETLQRRFEAGGTTMWFLLFLSVLSLAFVLERFVRLRRGKIAPPGMADRLLRMWQQNDVEGIRKLCHRRRRSTLGKVAIFAFENRDRPHEQVNAALGDIAQRDISKHQMLAYPLAAIATLSPLLGLFGTIIGMIDSFEVVAIAGSLGDPRMLAGGISKALVTTAFGLFIAIPTLFFFHTFRLRTNFLATVLEQDTSALTNAWLLNARENGAAAGSTAAGQQKGAGHEG